MHHHVRVDMCGHSMEWNDTPHHGPAILPHHCLYASELGGEVSDSTADQNKGEQLKMAVVTLVSTANSTWVVHDTIVHVCTLAGVAKDTST